MKKRSKIILIIIGSIIILTILFGIVDYFRAKNNQSPIFAIPVNRYKDGGSIEYFGIGYKVIKCNTLNGTKKVEIGFYNLKYNCNTDIYTRLNEINNKIIEYFNSGKKNTFNLSANYVDSENKVVIVELLTNSKEDQETFKKLVVNSEYIRFVKGGPYTTSNYELNEKVIAEIAFNYLAKETQNLIINRENPNIEILEPNDYEVLSYANNVEIKNTKVYTVEFFRDFLGLPNNTIVVIDYETLKFLGIPLVD